MKKRILSAAMCAALLTGCQTERHPIPELPPVTATAKTSSTYTGTTVDFIHVRTETQTEKKRPSDKPYMPDFPEAENMFDDSFSALFSSSQTSSGTSEASSTTVYSEEEGIVTAAPPRFDDADRVSVTAPPDTAAQSNTETAAETAESFDIEEYMPREGDYPEFPVF